MAAKYEYDLLVLNGLVVTDQNTEELDIAVKDEKIVELLPKGGFGDIPVRKIIDARGGMVMVRTKPRLNCAFANFLAWWC
jgi:formylmethanofuran dehydrogenase subunit A